MTPTITLVGCGFLGSIIATELGKLAFAGELPDTFNLVDFDRVDHRNAANQNFTRKDEGRYKVDVLADQLRLMHINVDWHAARLHADSTFWLAGSRLIIDAVDNLEARQCLWAYAMRTGIP